MYSSESVKKILPRFIFDGHRFAAVEQHVVRFLGRALHAELRHEELLSLGPEGHALVIVGLDKKELAEIWVQRAQGEEKTCWKLGGGVNISSKTLQKKVLYNKKSI